jgi:hypothetical protein
LEFCSDSFIFVLIAKKTYRYHAATAEAVAAQQR